MKRRPTKKSLHLPPRGSKNQPTTAELRSHAVAEIAQMILRDRAQMHGGQSQGGAESNLIDTAAIWSIILRDKLTRPLTAVDVAAMMCGAKLARFAYNNHNIDNGLDAGGYAILMAAQQMREQQVVPTRRVEILDR